MKVTDTLLQEYIESDPVFAKHVSDHLVDRNKADFFVADVDGSFRALIANDAIVASAPLSSRSEVERIDNAAKALAIRGKMIPAHIRVESKNSSSFDFRRIHDHMISGGAYSPAELRTSDLKAMATDYVRLKESMAASGLTQSKPEDQLQSEFNAWATTTKLRTTAASMLQNAQAFKPQQEAETSADYILDNRVLTGLATTVVSTIAYTSGYELSQSSIEAAGAVGFLGGTLIAASGLAKFAVQGTHEYLLEKSDWYRSRTEAAVGSSIRRRLDDLDIQSPGQLSNQAVTELADMVRIANPRATLEQASNEIVAKISERIYEQRQQAQMDTAVKYDYADQRGM